MTYAWFNGYGPGDDGKMRAESFGEREPYRPMLTTNPGSADIAGTEKDMEFIARACNAYARSLMTTPSTPTVRERVRDVTGVELIAAERERQQAERDYSREHDRQHTSGELAGAAARYAMPPKLRELPVLKHTLGSLVWPRSPDHYGWVAWRFEPSPDDRVRELVKAGALIAAEIDRLNDGVQP